MFDTDSELQQQIQLGEDSFLELKAVSFRNGRWVETAGLSRSEIADEFAAFANAKGGVVVFGVDDRTKEVSGIPAEGLDALEGLIREILNDSISPPLTATVRKLRLPDSQGVMRPIIRVDIPKSLFVHKSPHGYFQRIGSSKREMRTEQLLRLGQQRSQARLIRFDEQPVPDTTLEDLDLEKVAKVFSPEMKPEEFLRKLIVLTPDEQGVARCSVGGLLLFGKEPQKYLKSARIEAVAYASTERDSNYQVATTSCEGTLDRQIREAYEFVKQKMSRFATKSPDRREFPQFDERAVFEALVNAVAHRDYAIHGSKVRVFLFPDRLVIHSPGDLPNSVTLDTMEERQSTRNELVVRFLSKIPAAVESDGARRFFMEARGEGVPLIIKQTLALSGNRPRYQLVGEELKLVIPGGLPAR